VGRNRGLTGKRALKEIELRYESFRQDARLPATFEVIYGHAWKPLPRVGPGGRPVIDIKVEVRGRSDPAPHTALSSLAPIPSQACAAMNLKPVAARHR